MKLLPMTLQNVDEVLAVEQRAYAHAWTRGNFVDSLAAHHWAQMLRNDADALVGYIVAMRGVEEMHLLNVTVAPPFRRQGHAVAMMDALRAEAQRCAATKVWLEVRPSNVQALALYQRLGFVQHGVRRGYYPAAHGVREDAWVFAVDVTAGVPLHNPTNTPCTNPKERPRAAH